MATVLPQMTLVEVIQLVNSWPEAAIFNGRIDGLAQFGIDLKAHLAHYASSVFEGKRYFAQAGGIFLDEEHNQRLVNSCRELRFEVPEGFTSFEKFVRFLSDIEQLVIAVNSAKDRDDPDLYVRPWVGRGIRDSGSGLHVRTWHVDPSKRIRTYYGVMTERWPAYLPIGEGEAGTAFLCRRWERPTRKTAPINAKCSANYVISTMASDDAAMVGAKEGLMIRTAPDGTVYVLDGPGQAIGIVENGVVTTPNPESSDILRSTTMTWAKEIVAPRLGILFRDGDIPEERLYAADELFFMGSATGFAPFGEVWDQKPDGTMMKHIIGTGKPGAVWAAFREEHRKATTGLDYHDNVTLVPSRKSALHAIAERVLEQLQNQQ